MLTLGKMEEEIRRYQAAHPDPHPFEWYLEKFQEEILHLALWESRRPRRALAEDHFIESAFNQIVQRQVLNEHRK